jgi:uncharacterized protein (TIRG00374 family)
LKKVVTSILKIGIPLGLGVYLVWYFFDTLTPEQKEEIADAIIHANYWWVLLSAIPAILSHWSRAYRWKYTLEPVGYKPDFMNSFMTVMIGYLINLAVPRLGEVSRCGFMNRYDKIPFDKLLGTVIAERIADLVILVGIIGTVVLIQYALISEYVNNLFADTLGTISPEKMLLFIIGAGVLGVGGLILVYRVQWKNKILVAIQNAIKGIVEGVMSILTMKHKVAFIGHTLFIWVMYFLMLYLNFFALEETSSISFSASLTAFVFGALAMALTNGGIGAYPIAIQAALSMYGFNEAAGGALGWIMWVAQTILVILIGAASMIYIPIYNKKEVTVEG